MLPSRQLSLIALTLLVVAAGCSAPPAETVDSTAADGTAHSTQSVTTAASTTTAPPRTTATPTPLDERRPPGPRLDIYNGYDGNLTVVARNGTGNDSIVLERTYPPVSGRITIGEGLDADREYRIRIRTESEVVWDRMVRPNEAYDLSVAADGNVTVVSKTVA